MGNQVGFPGAEPAEQEEIRNNYYELVGDGLKAKPIPQEKPGVGKLFSVEGSDGVPAHYAVVTHGCAWKVGTEFIVRFVAGDDKKALELDKMFEPMLGMVLLMQDTAKFKSNETCELTARIPFVNANPGTPGAIIVEDDILKGTNYKPGDFPEEGPQHDKNKWPQHFLNLYALFPEEYLFTKGVGTGEFTSVIARGCPFWINDFSRMSLLENPVTAEALRELKLNSASKSHVTGLLCDLRLRKGGQEIDIIYGGRWMAPFLEALQQTFDKPNVPKGSVVTAIDEKNSSISSFYCRDEEGIGELITPDTAYFTVTEFVCARMPTTVEERDAIQETGPEIMELSPEDARAYSLLPQILLQVQKGAYRRLTVDFYLPAGLMANMISDVRDTVFADDTRGFDWDARPLIMQWEQQFYGKNKRSGFGEALRSDPVPDDAEATPAKFRFICAGVNYFEDGSFIDDDGDFVIVDNGSSDEGSDNDGEEDTRAPETADTSAD